MKNYYAILEVPVGSSVPEVRAAYRRLVQDNLWNRDTFAQLKEAYEVLTTPARRSEYDRAQFGETFPAGTDAPPSGENGSPARAARACPMGAASQCPVLNARVPLAETFCPECGVLLSAMPDAAPGAFAGGKAEARLEDVNGQAFPLRPGANIVGREGADILLPDKTVSRRHAQIVLAADGRSATLEDLGSTNGTRLAGNAEPLAPGQARPVSGGAVLQFGSVETRLHLPAPPTAAPAVPTSPAGPARGQFTAARGQFTAARGQFTAARSPQGAAVPLVEGVTTFGRRVENTVVLNGDPYVSGTHAQVIADGDLFRLSDLGSTNGTRVNGAALLPDTPHLLSEGDEVVIGGMVYRFERIVPEADTPVSTENQL